jgi:hypothetical protein
VIGAATVLLGATTAPAHAVDVAPLLEDAARALPKLRPVEFRLPRVGLTALSETKYGISDATVISQLDDAKAIELKTVDSAVSEVGSAAESSTVEDAAKECVKESFKKTAEDYANAAEQATTYPVFYNAFDYAVYGCLAAAFPHASQDDVSTVANYLTSSVSQPAQDAVAAAPTTFANWLAATGSEVSASSADPDPTTPPATRVPPTGGDSGDGSGSLSPWWFAVVGALGVGAYFVYRGRQR